MKHTTGDLFALVTAAAPLPTSALSGMELVESNTNPDWREAALSAVRRVAQRLPLFTTDDVWAELDACEIPVHNNSALGPVMRAASKSGLITDTMAVRPSERDSRHGNRLRVWRSTIFNQEQTK